VSNNPYQDDAGVTPRRKSLDGGVLGVYVARHESGWQLARGLIRVAFGGIRHDPHIDTRTARRLVIAPRRRHIDMSVDGEIERLATPLVFRSLPGALSVVVPSSDG
jgi:diacylglycerol kinase family enzyme